MWDRFRKIMGVTDFTQIYYDLSSLITALPMEPLNLDSDFTKDEITSTIKNLPNNHAPRPDGFK